ncbi:hypothetical protein [Bowmanella sp. JS7-9]|uniref:DUF4064 domain-containing protein n=1 Tax=Pseudobowmanella zhangzhouensis TaxID=1537679 RepID=A0ABW1XL74_9ALTE|nr:hypothetical protein [Bowmanella sp. JS7-9]TBX22127.1 hypothetical protein TK45_09415 [Bowmanella sp. JS7-9]
MSKVKTIIAFITCAYLLSFTLSGAFQLVFNDYYKVTSVNKTYTTQEISEAKVKVKKQAQELLQKARENNDLVYAKLLCFLIIFVGAAYLAFLRVSFKEGFYCMSLGLIAIFLEIIFLGFGIVLFPLVLLVYIGGRVLLKKK